MNIQTSLKLSTLPTLPTVPNGGKGRLEVDIPFQAPDTVETRLGSIPGNYETSYGYTKSETIRFEEGQKEATNRYGSSVEVWRAQPTYNADGSAKLKDASEHLVAEPKSKVTTPLFWGLGGAAGGAAVGAIVGLVANFHPGLGAAVGATVAGLAVGALGYRDADTDRVKLEWQETNIVDHNLTGYHYRVTEDTKEVCHGVGKDRRCHTETDDYEHRFSALIDEKIVGTYHQPVVVHYKEKK
jgi:hypothetical protein